MELDAVTQKFILHWGEMGTRWGINRTVAQIHALLFLSSRPLHAEEIAGALSVARSNVSTSLKELQNWGIVKVVHVMGDRRDHFETMSDVWEMFRVVLAERKKREIDPTVAVLRECVREAREKKSSKETLEKLGRLQDFFETLVATYDQLQQVPTSSMIRFFSVGGKLKKIFSRK